MSATSLGISALASSVAVLAWALPAAAQLTPPPAQPSYSSQPSTYQSQPSTQPSTYQSQPSTYQSQPSATAAGGAQQSGSSATESQLKEAEAKDAKRGLEWFWMSAEGGISHVSLTSLSGKDSEPLLAGPAKSAGFGPSLGVGAGVRLFILTVGVRGRMAMMPDFQYLSISPEVGLHIPLGNLEPYVFIGGGYSRLLGLSDANSGSRVHGGNIRLGAGLDYYLTPNFSAGAIVSGESTFLGRSKLGGDATTPAEGQALSEKEQAQNVLRTTEGSGIGTVVTASAVLALHF